MVGSFEAGGKRTHFEVFGFPVHVGWQFFIWPVLSGIDWRTGPQLIEWIFVVFASVLLHELGHALAYRRSGSEARIELWGLGGLTYGSQPRTRKEDLIVSLAGPVPPLLFVGLPAYLAYRNGVFEYDYFWRQTLLDIWFANLFWSLINLVPLLPLDGGRVVDKWFGRAPARITSIVFGAVASVVLFVYHQTSLAILALILGGINAYTYSKERSLGTTSMVGYMETPGGMRYGPGVETERTKKRRPGAPKQDRKSKKKAKAEEKAKAARWKPTEPASPKEDEVWAALEQGDLDRAAKVMAKLGPGASPVLIGAVMARQGKSSAAVAAYGTGLAAGAPCPPVADRIMAEAGIAGQVAEWILSEEGPRSQQLLLRLSTRLLDGGHGEAATQVGDVWSAGR